MSQNKLHIYGLLTFAYFMTVEILYDIGDAEYKADWTMHYYFHLAVMFTLISFILRSMSENLWIQLCWSFFSACAGNWAFRFYFHSPNIFNWHEYMWAAIFLIAIPIQYYIKKNRIKKGDQSS